MNDEKIEQLWKWFSDNEHQIRDCIDNESASERKRIVEELNNLILDLGMFYWEIGPGIDKPWYLTISPNCKIDLMIQSKTIMDRAPDLAHWEYNFCKPLKYWDRKFMLHDDNMIERNIDASGWMFVANQHEDGTIELILEAQNIAHLDNYTKKAAADLVVLNEIGEEAKILSIRSVDIVHLLESPHVSGKIEIQHLKKHLDKLSASINKRK